jgi:hypothetical protein
MKGAGSFFTEGSGPRLKPADVRRLTENNDTFFGFTPYPLRLPIYGSQRPEEQEDGNSDRKQGA